MAESRANKAGTKQGGGVRSVICWKFGVSTGTPRAERMCEREGIISEMVGGPFLNSKSTTWRKGYPCRAIAARTFKLRMEGRKKTAAILDLEYYP